MSLTTDLLDLYREDPEGRKALVIQNLGDSVHEENLQNYLEIICTDHDITDICLPCQDGGVAIAIFKTNLNDRDIETFQNKSSKKRFNGAFLNIERLREPDGIFVPEVPSEISEEYLNLYFENKKSGGKEESVTRVTITDTDMSRQAVVNISSTSAINSILSKQTHLIKRKDVKLQPYYTTVQGYIADHRKERQGQSGSIIYDRKRSADINRENTSPVRARQPFTKPALGNPLQQVDIDIPNRRGKVFTEQSKVRSDESPSSYRSNLVTSQQFTNNKNVRPRFPAEAVNVGQEDENSAFKLRIISDDCDDHAYDVDIGSRDQNKSAGIRDDVILSMSSDRESGCENYPARNIAAEKPVARNLQRQLSNESIDNNRKTRGARGRRPRAKDDNCNKRSLNCQQEIQIPSVKINMLIIFRFQSKTKSDTVEVEFKEGEGKVIIKGSSEDDVRDTQLRMHECLEQLVCSTETFPRTKCEFLAREENRRCIRSRCIKQKIKAAFDVDVSNSVLRSYAFSYDEAEKGLQFFKDEITVIKVNLRPGQEQLVKEDEWTKFVQGLAINFTIIYQDDNSNDVINIESFMEMKAKDIYKKIIQYLKQNVPTKTAEITLTSAKARCFKSCFEESLRRTVQKSRGKLNVVEVQSHNPYMIRVCVEGEETLSAELTKIVKQIWHEKIDFKKISDKVEDRWLIMKGLCGTFGKDFFSKFEKSHNCFIQISKDGDIKVARPSVLTENAEANKQADVASSLETSDTDSNRGDVIDMDLMLEYQSEWDEEEALELARAMSIDDMNRHSAIREIDDDDDIFSPTFARRQNSEGEMNFGRQRIERTLFGQLLRSSSSPEIPRRHVQQDKSESINMMQTRVTVMTGEIVRQRADVLVNIVSPSYNLSESLVSKSFVKRAGQDIFKLFNDARQTSIGNVVTTASCGKLRCKSVMHVVLKKGNAYCQQMIHDTIQEVLQECQASGYSSVIFPPLGIGRMCKYPPDTVAERMLIEIYQNIQNSIARPHQVTIVIYDDQTYTVFEKALKAFDVSSASRNAVTPARPFSINNLFLQGLGQAPMPQQNQQQQRMRQFVRPQQNQLAQQTYNTNLQPVIPAVPQTGRPAPVAHRPHGILANFMMGKTPDQNKSGGRKIHHKHHRTEQEQNVGYDKRKMPREKRPPRHRFAERMPVPNLCVVVLAEDKDTCILARNDLGKKIKDEFLHEETIDKRQKISDQAKSKIVSIIEKRHIESMKANQKYILKGHKESVTRARMDILEILLGEKDTVEKRRKRKENTRRETKEFVKYMVEEEPGVPSYWSNYKPDVSLKSILTSVKRTVTGKNYEKVEIPQNSWAFNTIVAMIKSTFDPSKVGQGQDAVGLGQCRYTQLRVLKIQRIENLELYDKFTMTRQKIFLRLFKSGEVRFPKLQELPTCTGPIQTSQHLDTSLDKDLHSEINEVLLFHGTKKDNIGTICTSGLDQRLGSGRAMFGPGIYGAETSTKADQYSDDKTNRSAGAGNHKKMFLMRMILGNSFICNDQNPHKYRRPPCTSCFKDDCKKSEHTTHKYGHMFDSVVGDNGKLFREFVVYDSSLCYPEYLITYERQ